MDLYHQDCPASSHPLKNNKSPWWLRFAYRLVRNTRDVVPFLPYGEEVGGMQTYVCTGCGTRIHVDL